MPVGGTANAIESVPIDLLARQRHGRQVGSLTIHRLRHSTGWWRRQRGHVRETVVAVVETDSAVADFARMAWSAWIRAAEMNCQSRHSMFVFS